MVGESSKESGNGAEFCPSYQEIQLANGVKLQVVGVEHDVKLFPKYKSQIEEAVGGSNFVAIESTVNGVDSPDIFGGGGYFGNIAALVPENIPVFSSDPASQENGNIVGIAIGVQELMGAPLEVVEEAVLLGNIGIDAMRLVRTRSKHSRRTLIKNTVATALGASILAPILATSALADNFYSVRNCAPAQPSPTNQVRLAPEVYRTSGMLAIVNRAAKQGKIHGSGVLFVGTSHAKEIAAFYRDPETAEKTFENTAFYKAVNVLGGLKASIWMRKGNRFVKTGSINAIS